MSEFSKIILLFTAKQGIIGNHKKLKIKNKKVLIKR